MNRDPILDRIHKIREAHWRRVYNKKTPAQIATTINH